MAGALIVVVESTTPIPEIALVSDDEGRFSLHLPAGEFHLEARSTGGVGRALVRGVDEADEIVLVVRP